MTSSEVEKLAREAGMEDWTNDGNWSAVSCDLARFAELIERAAMEKAAQIAERHYIYGHSVAGPEFAARGAAAIRAAAQKQV